MFKFSFKCKKMSTNYKHATFFNEKILLFVAGQFKDFYPKLKSALKDQVRGNPIKLVILLYTRSVDLKKQFNSVNGVCLSRQANMFFLTFFSKILGNQMLKCHYISVIARPHKIPNYRKIGRNYFNAFKRFYLAEGLFPYPLPLFLYWMFSKSRITIFQINFVSDLGQS